MPLALIPGVHHVQVDWQCDDAAGVIRCPLVDLHVASSNVTTTLQVGQAMLAWALWLAFALTRVGCLLPGAR